METNKLPEEFYKSSNFYTLAGTSGAVWLLCVVIGSLDSKGFLSPFVYRIIAIIASLIIAVIMMLKRKINNAEYWMFAFFNGLLIFVNASGLNAITSNKKYGYVTVEEINGKQESNIKKETVMNAASFFDFEFKNISWWQDNGIFLENRKLKESNFKLTNDLKLVNNENKLLSYRNNCLSDLLNSKSGEVEVDVKDEKLINKTNLKEVENYLQENYLIKNQLKNYEVKIENLNSTILSLKDQLAENKNNFDKTQKNNDFEEQKRKLEYEIKRLKEQLIECKTFNQK